MPLSWHSYASGAFTPHFKGKRQGSICHDDKVAYRPLIIW